MVFVRRDETEVSVRRPYDEAVVLQHVEERLHHHCCVGRFINAGLELPCLKLCRWALKLLGRGSGTGQDQDATCGDREWPPPHSDTRNGLVREPARASTTASPSG